MKSERIIEVKGAKRREETMRWIYINKLSSQKRSSMQSLMKKTRSVLSHQGETTWDEWVTRDSIEVDARRENGDPIDMIDDFFLSPFFLLFILPFFALVYPSVSGLCLCKHWQSQSSVCTHTTGEQTCSSWAMNMMKIFSRAKVDGLFFTLPSSPPHKLVPVTLSKFSLLEANAHTQKSHSIRKTTVFH